MSPTAHCCIIYRNFFLMTFDFTPEFSLYSVFRTNYLFLFEFTGIFIHQVNTSPTYKHVQLLFVCLLAMVHQNNCWRWVKTRRLLIHSIQALMIRLLIPPFSFEVLWWPSPESCSHIHLRFFKTRWAARRKPSEYWRLHKRLKAPGPWVDTFKIGAVSRTAKYLVGLFIAFNIKNRKWHSLWGLLKIRLEICKWGDPKLVSFLDDRTG